MVVYVQRCFQNGSENLGLKVLKDFDVRKVNSGTEIIILEMFHSCVLIFLVYSFLLFNLWVIKVLKLIHSKKIKK
jgi:hypothetical protein